MFLNLGVGLRSFLSESWTPSELTSVGYGDTSLTPRTNTLKTASGHLKAVRCGILLFFWSSHKVSFCGVQRFFCFVVVFVPECEEPWVPTISSAVGVHMELVAQVPHDSKDTFRQVDMDSRTHSYSTWFTLFVGQLLNENDNDGLMAILMVTGYAQGPCAKELWRKGVKQSRARCPTYNR